MSSSKIISKARLQANRGNAMRSTGPRTEAGKNKSRLNGITHGLAGNTIVAPWENPAEFDAFVLDVFAELEPRDEAERALAQSIAGDRWRLKRARAVEESILAQPGDFDHPALNQAQAFLTHSRQILLVSAYEQRIRRSHDKSYAALNTLQSERRAARKRDLEEASERLKLSRMRNLPFDAVADGFGYSYAEIARHTELQRRLWQARALFQPSSPHSGSLPKDPPR